MTNSRDDNVRAAAIQYLTWALEEIEKMEQAAGNQIAAKHAREALKALHSAMPKETQLI